jgi:hypothetical protein
MLERMPYRSSNAIIAFTLLVACARGVELDITGGNTNGGNGSGADSSDGGTTGQAAGPGSGGSNAGGDGLGGENPTGGTGAGAGPTCGDGQLDPGETCDPASTCPTSCDDGDACTSDLTNGSIATCNVACNHTPVTACVPDGCCPAGCSSANDPDCGPPTFGPVHSFAGYSSSFYITQFACSNAGGDPAGDALWFCQHFYAPTCTALPGVQAVSNSVDAMMHSGTNCFEPEPVGVDVPGTQCIGGPCKIGNYVDYAPLNGITNIVCQCP